MEEQFRKGEIKKEEYEKAKKVNTERLDSIKKKIDAASKKASKGKSGTISDNMNNEPASWEGGTGPAPAGPPEETGIVEKQAPDEETEKKKPVESPPAKTTEKKSAPEKEGVTDDKEGMINDLQESLDSGEISRNVFERVKKKLMKK